MKSKSKKSFLKKKKELRFHFVAIKKPKNKITKIRHPAYVFLEKGNLYIYVSLTHSSYIKDHVIVELKKNPNSDDSRKAYWVAEIKEDIKSTFSKKQIKWKMSAEDDERIRKFFYNNKK